MVRLVLSSWFLSVGVTWLLVGLPACYVCIGKMTVYANFRYGRGAQFFVLEFMPLKSQGSFTNNLYVQFLSYAYGDK